MDVSLSLLNFKTFIMKKFPQNFGSPEPRTTHPFHPKPTRETPPKFGSGIAVAGVRKVVGAFENRLKEQMHYPKSTGITISDRKVGNHY